MENARVEVSLDKQAHSAVTLGEVLLEWYCRHRRELPWRGHVDAYAIWVAEVMLQQTRVEAVIPYFERWMRSFPNVAALAQASEKEVLRLWEGLGYYQRALNLQRAARLIVEQYGGELPRQVEALRRLPGIGPYTAAAIASFAFGMDEIALDGNLKRVLARLSDLDRPLDKKEAQKQLEHFAHQHLPKGRSAEFNQALMDLGAEICLPERPLCETCPLQAFCQAYQRGTDQTLIIANYVETLAAARLADQQFRANPSPEAAARLAGHINALAITPAVMDAFSGMAEEQAMLE
ncbi:MAG: A/G-specific adenine glycosylase, partial [Anaerolineales bacterium]